MHIILLLHAVAALIGDTDAMFTDKIIHYKPVDPPMYAVTAPEGATWLELRAKCNAEHVGYFLSTLFDMFPPGVEALCPAGSLVPIAVLLIEDQFYYDRCNRVDYKLMHSMKEEPLQLSTVNKSGPFGALVWPTPELRMFDNAAKFTCAVCGMAYRADVVAVGVYPPHDNAEFVYDLEAVSDSRVDDLASVADGSELSTQLLGDLAEGFNVSASLLRHHSAALDADGKAVVHVHYAPGDVTPEWAYYVQWNDEYVHRPRVAHFRVTMVKLDTECLVEKTFLTNVRRSMYQAGDVDVRMANQMVTVRECYWDVAQATALWSQPILWLPVYGILGLDYTWQSLVFANRNDFKKEMRNNDIEVALFVDSLDLVKSKYVSLLSLAMMLNIYEAAHMSERPYASLLSIMSYSLPRNLAKYLMRLEFYQGVTSDMASQSLCTFVVADREEEDPLVGLAVTVPELEGDVLDVVRLNKANSTVIPATAHLAVTVSDSIATTATRLAVAAYAVHLDLPNQTNMYDDSIDGWMAVVQVVFKRADSDLTDPGKDFIDVAFKPVFHLPTLRGKCAERDVVADQWFGDSCRVLKSARDQMLVCRCKNLRRDGELTDAVYIVYGFDAHLSTFLANNLTLVIVMVCVCAMSALGLLSVVLTAACFPAWRQDQGHKIFMQMTLALTVNLILGFLNNFLNVDTRSAACVAIGVLRHYSFLAMFFWMLVLSALQVKRLTSISGAKATTHLILKVSLTAWGLPLIPIVILLAWDTGFYKSEVSNRGYCYPEDVAFQATVQGPAGLILFVNLVVFVVILNHIYGWVKCDREVVVRKHTADDRAAQLRNLGNSIFVFFLFGFTWTFHFLSEEGIINSEFLFEYLFLITASFHLLMLSLFFIVLDKKTRALWRKAFGLADEGARTRTRVAPATAARPRPRRK